MDCPLCDKIFDSKTWKEIFSSKNAAQVAITLLAVGVISILAIFLVSRFPGFSWLFYGVGAAVSAVALLGFAVFCVKCTFFPQKSPTVTSTHTVNRPAATDGAEEVFAQ